MAGRILFWREFILVSKEVISDSVVKSLNGVLERCASEGYSLLISDDSPQSIPKSILLGVPSSERGLMLKDCLSNCDFKFSDTFPYRYNRSYYSAKFYATKRKK